MNDYYTNSENYEIWNKFIFPKSEEKRREMICIPNLNRIMEICRLMEINDPSLLEIGSGFGTFASLVNDTRLFRSVSVVERTPSMANACRAKGLNVIESAFEDLAFEMKESVDIVCCFEVLEHVFDPIQFLAVVNKLLKIGGIFFFTCPNGKGFDTEMLQSASPSVDNEHVNLFNLNSVAVLLKRAGFELIQSETPGRLDVEIVRRAVIANELELPKNSFLRPLFLEKNDVADADLQRFLVEHNLSGSMRISAQKII